MIFGLFLILLLFAPVPDGSVAFFRPVLLDPEEIKPVLEYISENRREGDLVYCFHNSGRAYSYYLQRFSLEDIEFVKGIYAKKAPQNYTKDIYKKARGRKRVWLVYSHVFKGSSSKEFHIDTVLAELERNKKKLDSFSSAGAGVVLYDMRGKE
jgi:hypothetical protein